MTRTNEVAAEIRRYCAAHPGVCDTLDGIAWWLAVQHCKETADELRAAVDALIDQKVLESIRLPDGTTVFACTGRQESPP